MKPIDHFRALAIAAGAKDLPRVLASGSLAVRYGDDPQYVLDCLLRNQPALFDSQLAAKRQKENYRERVLQTPDQRRWIEDDLPRTSRRSARGRR